MKEHRAGDWILDLDAGTARFAPLPKPKPNARALADELLEIATVEASKLAAKVKAVDVDILNVRDLARIASVALTFEKAIPPAAPTQDDTEPDFSNWTDDELVTFGELSERAEQVRKKKTP